MDEIIKYMLREDEGFGDITSNALIPENKIFYAKLKMMESLQELKS